MTSLLVLGLAVVGVWGVAWGPEWLWPVANGAAGSLHHPDLAFLHDEMKTDAP